MTIDIYESSGTTFRTRLFGFDKSEVRACVQNLVHDHDEAQRQVERVTTRLKALEQAHEHGPAPDSMGVQVEKVLASAHKIAEDILREAEVAARKIQSDAHEEALHLRTQAETDAAALTASAMSRVTELKSEIERMTERRDSLQAQLREIADQLDEFSRQLRGFGERDTRSRSGVKAKPEDSGERDRVRATSHADAN